MNFFLCLYYDSVQRRETGKWKGRDGGRHTTQYMATGRDANLCCLHHHPAYVITCTNTEPPWRPAACLFTRLQQQHKCYFFLFFWMCSKKSERMFPSYVPWTSRVSQIPTLGGTRCYSSNFSAFRNYLSCNQTRQHLWQLGWATVTELDGC